MRISDWSSDVCSSDLIFKAVRTFIPVMDRTLGKGSDEPGIHVRLNVVESRGKYLTGKDAPRYSTSGKTRCPYVTGQARRSAPGTGEIGRAQGRERGCQYV